MPRTKASRPNSRTQLEVGFGDALPALLLDSLFALKGNDQPVWGSSEATSPEPQAEAPSPKRRRLDPPDGSHVPVARGHISFTRRVSELSPLGDTVVRRNVGAQVAFLLHDEKLKIIFRSGSPNGPLLVYVSLEDHDTSENVVDIINVSNNNVGRKAPGPIWAQVDVSVTASAAQATVKLDLSLFWDEILSPYLPLRLKKDRGPTQLLVNAFFPQRDRPVPTPAWSPMDFYDAAFVPPKDDSSAQLLEVPGLESTLYPYQKRTLQWMLKREGVRWSASIAATESIPQDIMVPEVDLFRKVTDVNGRELYLSDVLQSITRDMTAFRQADMAVKGGILAEEMGLGKTLEVLGLITLNQRPNLATVPTFDGSVPLLPSGATLIVTPESLRQQWLSEIARHAPALRVVHYQGCRKVADEEEEDMLVAELAGCDVVITTYSVLSAELHFTEEPPARSRRHERAYRRTKSPLVRISWWRLCLDEAQMIENGYSKAATVARVIPRLNAWGITGTPVKDGVKDLYGLLLFLRYEPYCRSQVWEALVSNKPLFQQLFRSIALRHTKALVRDELSLPPQKRFVISMPFTAIEEQHYQSLFKEMTEACDLNTDGEPVVDDWTPEDHEENMRTWLNRLRQAALHPEVGVYNRRTLGQGKNRPIRTVDEVLDAMLEQSENLIRTEERSYLMGKLTRGQLFENSPRVKEALDIWQDVRKETGRVLEDAGVAFEECLREHASEVAVRKISNSKTHDDVDTDDETEELENKGKVGEVRRRLRAALEMHHRAVFFCANAHFQMRDNAEMTEPESEEFRRLKKLEDDGYDEAKALRRQILQQPRRRAGRFMTKLSRKAHGQSFTEVPELDVNPEKGIETGRVVGALEVLYGELNEQANLLDEWREHIIQLLLRSLVDEDDEVETTGEELMDSAKFQDELIVHVTALRAVISDRQEAISGQPSELTRHETETSIKMAKEAEGPAPEKLLALMKLRQEMKPKMANTTMRAAIGDFRSIATRLSRDAAPGSREAVERKIANDQLKVTQQLLHEQTKAALSLESEVEGFKSAMNSRVEYYRQLQTVSDSVLPYDGPNTEQVMERMKRAEDDSRRKLSMAQSKHRYLLHLKEAGSKSNEPRMCVICQTPFATGILTVCGHQFCKECMTLWFRAHHNCPVCKQPLKQSNLHDISIKPQDLQVHNEGSGNSSQSEVGGPNQGRQGGSKTTMIYSEFNLEKLAEVQNIELEGPSFTTKVDTLVRHLLWLRQNDPGAKSIIFSQYKDFLHVLRKAFSKFRIGHASIDEHNGIVRFKSDPAIECFLLHARAHSSGLNLVNASHVFLCEPLLNTALELQAIARVDRIGQQHETTVWLYLVSGTVEESIYNLSVRRRMEHMGRAAIKGKSKESTPELLDASIDAANTLELEHAALTKLMSRDSNAGEVVEQGDLWECLFGQVAAKKSVAPPAQDSRLQEQAVMSFMAGEAAEARKEAGA